MKKSFITFWKDMWESQKETTALSNMFLKKHWKGYLVFAATAFATGCMIPSMTEKIQDFIETRKEKSEEKES